MLDKGSVIRVKQLQSVQESLTVSDWLMLCFYISVYCRKYMEKNRMRDIEIIMYSCCIKLLCL